jgi:hypothetical protein
LEARLEDVLSSGVFSWATTVTAAVRTAAAAIALPGAALSRTEQAVAVSAGGHAHALDDGTTAAALVRRALAAEAGDPLPTSTSGRRDM